MICAEYVFGQGSGKCHVAGPCGRSDEALMDAVRIGHSFIRLMADEICSWFGHPSVLATQLKEPTKDIVVKVEQHVGGGLRDGHDVRSLSNGFAGLLGQSKAASRGGLGGTGGAILIALLQTCLGIQPLAQVAIAADITLSGKVVSAGGLVTRVNAAVSTGIRRFVVSREDEDEACRRLDASQREMLLFAEDIFDLFEYSILGKSSLLYRLFYMPSALMDGWLIRCFSPLFSLSFFT